MVRLRQYQKNDLLDPHERVVCIKNFLQLVSDEGSEAEMPSPTVATLSKFATGDEFFKPVFPRKMIRIELTGDETMTNVN